MVTRSEVRHAREVARQDPAWLRTWYWPLWIVAVVLSFGIPEAIAIVHPGAGGTKSERWRAWLGIDPPRRRRRFAWAGLVAVVVGFAVWFPLHLQRAWPWE